MRFVNDEARSFIARSTTRADIIQISLIDTWAATASGAFVLTENSLYTVEAWRTVPGSPGAARHPVRLALVLRGAAGRGLPAATLASTTLRRWASAGRAITIAIVRARPAAAANAPDGIGTLLVSRDPLSAADLDALESVAARMQFDVVQSPRHSADQTFADIASAGRLAAAIAGHPLNIAAPTDDRPFFFYMLRLRDVFDTARWRDQGIVQFNMAAVGVLGVLFVTVLVLTALCIGLPLLLSSARRDLTGAGPHLIFFAAIGFGFMLVEISQVQRLAVFLGIPSTACRSCCSRCSCRAAPAACLPAACLAGRTARDQRSSGWCSSWSSWWRSGAMTPAAVRHFEAASTTVRILVSVIILFPLGFFMGMAFPIGMRRALRELPTLAPWLWGVNGAASVCASVAAVVIAIGAGISAAFWTGVACYGAALAALAWADRRLPAAEERRDLPETIVPRRGSKVAHVVPHFLSSVGTGEREDGSHG